MVRPVAGESRGVSSAGRDQRLGDCVERPRPGKVVWTSLMAVGMQSMGGLKIRLNLSPACWKPACADGRALPLCVPPLAPLRGHREASSPKL